MNADFPFRARILRLLNPSGVFLLGLAATLLAGCGKSEQGASSALEELRYRATAQDLLLAAETGDLEAIPLFLSAGIPVDAVDEGGNTALMRAAAGGREAVVNLLLDEGADPHLASAVGRTAMMNAAEHGRIEVLRLLLDRGGNFETRDSEGWTALKLAAFHGQAEVVEILATRVEQETLDQALLVASFKGDTAVIDQLMNHGAYINTRSPENMTPLMISAQTGNEDAVKLLLQNQANPYALDDSERTAANLATGAGFEELGLLLLDPTSILEMAESGANSDSLLVEEDPLLAEAAIAGALPALNGGESLLERGLLYGEDGNPISPSPGVITTGPSTPRLASINGRIIGQGVRRALTGMMEEPDGVAASGSVPLRNPALEIDRRDASLMIGMAPIGDPVRAMKMKHYREEPLPVMLKGVETSGETAASVPGGLARVRVLSSPDPRPVSVKAGELIPGTNLRVASVNSRFISSKMGKGELLDVSSILVEDTRTGAKHMLVKDVPGRSSATYATVVVPGSSYQYVVKDGDRFRAVVPDAGEQDFEVLDVRPTQVVIRNVNTDEVLTVNRGGLAMR